MRDPRLFILTCYSSNCRSSVRSLLGSLSAVHGSLGLGQCRGVLITVGLECSLKSGSMIPPVLFFFLKLVLALQSLLQVLCEFWNFLFKFCEKCHWNLHRDCNELIDCFVCYGHFNNIVVV